MADGAKDMMAMPLRVGAKYSIGGQLVTIKGKWKQTPSGESYSAQWASPKDARDSRSGYLTMNNDGSFILRDNSGSVVSQGASGFGSASPIRASRPGAPDTFAVEDRFYFGKGRKERFASISMPRQSVTSGASGTWKKREVTVRGKKAWLVELYRGSVLVGYLNQHPDTRQFHAFDGNTDQQIGVGSESEMKRLVESL